MCGIDAILGPTRIGGAAVCYCGWRRVRGGLDNGGRMLWRGGNGCAYLDAGSYLDSHDRADLDAGSYLDSGSNECANSCADLDSSANTSCHSHGDAYRIAH